MSGPIGQGEDSWLEQQYEDRFFEPDLDDDTIDSEMYEEDA